MKHVVWGAPSAGKTSIAAHLDLPDRFRGDESLAYMVVESSGADVALVVFDVTVPAQVQAARCQVAARQAGIAHVVVAVNKVDLAGYEYEAFKAARAVFLRGWHGVPPVFVPVSARYGDLLHSLGNRIDWYAGPTLAELLGVAAERAAA
jgi:sulfate adenylyltransferase subunit 1 (EFTu-like GTPase family)